MTAYVCGLSRLLRAACGVDLVYLVHLVYSVCLVCSVCGTGETMKLIAWGRMQLRPLTYRVGLARDMRRR